MTNEAPGAYNDVTSLYDECPERVMNYIMAGCKLMYPVQFFGREYVWMTDATGKWFLQLWK